MGKAVAIDCTGITDWPSFHAVFADAFGFPDWYGHNRDAWIDCMTWLDDDGTVAAGGPVTLHLTNTDDLKRRAPDILTDTLEMAAFVNGRRIEKGLTPILILSCDA
ncbi:barstar family protein [Oceaniglobus trochenteri]|uniref:barstar family protein n=1 Tax=Oceaniglobus trochenteri TaxID=2763260 RepID=UPI001CFF571C|nr:barstar family protein [Oceaniglobus trochenteri]